MKELEKIQFVAANYATLKGLNMSIIGLLLLGTSLWADKHQGDLSAPLIMLLMAAFLWVGASRYYRNTYGQVKATKKNRQIEKIASLVFGVLGLAAFVVDTYQIVPVSLIGIVFAVSMLGDYYRLNRFTQQKFLPYYPWFAVGLLFVSILPGLGFESFWKYLGFQDPVSGTLSAVGLLIVIIGILLHLFLVGTFSSHPEVGNDQTV